MTARRDLLIGAACLATAGAAYGLAPRRRLSLIGRAKLDDIVPDRFGAWSGRDVGDLVAPKIEGGEMSKLYSQTLERVYGNADSGAEIMMLIAHGDTQTNALQLHRPEVCYPAFGFEISSNRVAPLPLGGAAVLPARVLVASAPERIENIIYWTRLGEFLPLTESEQRLDRLKTALGGYIADGLLARFSIVGPEAGAAMSVVQGFVQGLVRAVSFDQRKVLIGTSLAAALAAG